MKSCAILVLLVAFDGGARACAVCLEHFEHALGMSRDGELVIWASEGTGESDDLEVWTLSLRRGLATSCQLTVHVGETESVIESDGPQHARCERLAGLGPADRVDAPERGGWFHRHKLDRTALLARVKRQLGVMPLVATAPPPITVPRLEDPDGYRGGEPIEQPILMRGVKIATVPAGSTHWFVTALRSDHFDGVVLHLITLLPSSTTRVGASSGCTDLFDGYLAIPTR